MIEPHSGQQLFSYNKDGEKFVRSFVNTSLGCSNIKLCKGGRKSFLAFKQNAQNTKLMVPDFNIEKYLLQGPRVQNLFVCN
jgi:hypothetical protein